MNRLIKKNFAILLMGLVMISCFEKFDPTSYQPKFEISGFSAVDEIDPANLVAYWSFDGTLKESVSGKDAVNSGTTFINGFKEQAISLNVSNKSYVTFAPDATITGMQSFTISFWVNPTFVDANGDNGIDGILGLVNLSNPKNFWGNIDWFVENGSNPNAAKIVAHIVSSKGETWMNVSGFKGLFDNWTNHTLTYDATTSKFTYYINGAVAQTATSSWGGPITFVDSGPMVFGTVHFQTNPTLANHGSEPWASYLTGSMDEIRIYNKALSAENVNALVVLQGKGK